MTGQSAWPRLEPPSQYVKFSPAMIFYGYIHMRAGIHVPKPIGPIPDHRRGSCIGWSL